MSFVTTDEVKAVMHTGLSETDLQAVIDREEGWLANDPHVGIGPLAGERTQTLWVSYGDDSPLMLQRPTAELTEVKDAGSLLAIDVDVALTGAARIEKINATWRGPRLEVKYTPTDSASVKGVIIELVRLAVTASSFQQESSEGHQYTRDVGGVRKMREDLARSLDPHQGMQTMQLLPGGRSPRLTDSPVR